MASKKVMKVRCIASGMCKHTICPHIQDHLEGEVMGCDKVVPCPKVKGQRLVCCVPVSYFTFGGKS